MPDLRWRRDQKTEQPVVVPTRAVTTDLVGLLMVISGTILLSISMFIWLGLIALLIVISVALIVLGLLLGYSKGNN